MSDFEEVLKQIDAKIEAGELSVNEIKFDGFVKPDPKQESQDHMNAILEMTNAIAINREINDRRLFMSPSMETFDELHIRRLPLSIP